MFFRSDSVATAFALLGRLVTGWTTPTAAVTPLVVGTIALMLALQYAPREPAWCCRNGCLRGVRSRWDSRSPSYSS